MQVHVPACRMASRHALAVIPAGPPWGRRGMALLSALVSVLAACAVGPKLVYHSFAFDAIADSPDIQVLDYVYGGSRAPGARMPEWIKRDVGFSAGTNINGPMPVGDRLYVRWRLRATDEVLEDTVDLQSRLPRDMAQHTVYFVVDRRQLRVYLVSPTTRPPGSTPTGPAKFWRFKVDSIYPDGPSAP